MPEAEQGMNVARIASLRAGLPIEASAVTVNRFNLLSRFNDDATGANALPLKHLVLEPRNWGEFRTPSLRNVAVTGPWMHNGSVATLRDAVLHYSTLDEERLHADGEKILRPLRLSEDEVADLVAFLESLSDRHGADRPRPAASPPCPPAPAKGP